MGGRASRPEVRPPQQQSSTCCSGWLSFKRRGKAQTVDTPVRATASPSSASSPDHAGLTFNADEGHAIFHAILGIEQRCLGGSPAPDEKVGDSEVQDNLTVECMLDEQDKRYFLCSSLSSPTVIAYFWLHIPDVRMEDMRLALVDCKERQQRDADSEYQELRAATAGDPTFCEDVAYILKAPWPFADREILQRRWQLPIGSKGEGLAIVMRSFEDDDLYPRRQDRVRAFVQKSAFILRPSGAPRGTDAMARAAASGARSSRTAPTEATWQGEDVMGFEMVVCQQIDLGGLCPAWAQRFLTRFAVQGGVEWSRKIRAHCISHHLRRQGRSVGEDASPSNIIKAPSSGSLSHSSAKARPMSGQEVLEAILAIERRCCCAEEGSDKGFPLTPPASPRPFGKEENSAADGYPVSRRISDAAKADAKKLVVECLLDEPTAKYCLCGSLDSPVVIGYIRVLLADVYPGDVWRALVATEERLLRDPESEYKVLRKAKDGDPTCQEDISYVWRAPWPFWDRDVLQRRWTFPLHDGEGLAIVMRSIEDEALLPLREDRVRAFIHKCGYLLRPLEHSKKEQLSDGDPAWNGGAGLELTVCQQVDLGGLCPDWAQEVLTRWAVNRGIQWSEELREHCMHQHWLRAETAGETPEPTPAPWSSPRTS